MNFTLYFLVDLKSRIEESRNMELDQQKIRDHLCEKTDLRPVGLPWLTLQCSLIRLHVRQSCECFIDTDTCSIFIKPF